MDNRRETEKICSKFLRLFKGVLVLYLSSHLHSHHSASCQIPLPATEREIMGIYGFPSSIKDITCNKRMLKDDQDLPRDCFPNRKTGAIRVGRNKSKNNGKKRKRDFGSKRRAEATKCRCRRTRALKDKERRDFMQDDHSTRDFLDTRPKLRVCKSQRCLTFTHSRRSFTAAENEIVSGSTFIESLYGVWEVCGEFAGTISCAVMSGDNFLDIYDEESVRITTFRRVDHPNEINIGGGKEVQLEDEIANGIVPDTSSAELMEKMQDVEDELSALSEHIYEMEDVMQRSTNLLLQDSYKNEQMRRKFMKVLERLANT